MSEYVPTTEDVKRSYVHLMHGFDEELGHYTDEEEADAEFSRWLSAHDAEIAAKALEEAAVCVTGDVWVADSTKPRGGLYWGASEWLNHLAAEKRGA